MNRIMTALMISSLFAAAPAFARTHKMGHKTSVVSKGGKAISDKTATDKPATGEVKGAEPKTDGSDAAKAPEAKPTKKVKKVKKPAKTEGSAEKPVETTPAK